MCQELSRLYKVYVQLGRLVEAVAQDVTETFSVNAKFKFQTSSFKAHDHVTGNGKNI